MGAVIAVAGCGSSSNHGASGSGGSSGSGSASTSGSGSTGGSSGTAQSSGSNGTGPAGAVQFTVDLSRGPARQFQPQAKPAGISPYIYGINAFGAWESTTKWTMLRWGGDSYTAWNWTNDFGNSGSDYCFWQGPEGNGSGVAGALALSTFPSVPTAQALGIAALITVPILDYVASSGVTNNVWANSTPACPGMPNCTSGTANGYAANVANLAFASTDPTSNAFVANHPTKGSPFCTCAGSSCGSCAIDTSGAVYEDEFVNYVKSTWGSSPAPIFFSLDNEPNYWAGTHPELWPQYTGTPGCGTSGTITFDDIVSRDTSYATAIKSVVPQGKVFGPVIAQDGVIYGGDYNDPNLKTTTFTDYYLGKMAAASATAGHPLIDAYDVHYYTSKGTADQCVQVPRMFWDPNFTTFTASQTDQIDFGWSGPSNYFDTRFYPRKMIPRLLAEIDAAYSGAGTPAPGLSFSEYNAGCETAIQGGVAEADLLGIFGREGVYAATAWPLQSITDTNKQLTNYLVAAYDLYRNYDGNGATVGDTAPFAQTSDVDRTSVYAFTHSDDATKVDVVALNKTNAAITVAISIQAAPSLTTATPYQLTGTKVGVASAGAAVPVTCAAGTCQLTVTLPPMSGTTLAVR